MRNMIVTLIFGLFSLATSTTIIVQFPNLNQHDRALCVLVVISSLFLVIMSVVLITLSLALNFLISSERQSEKTSTETSHD
jgi:hypothetical protein